MFIEAIGKPFCYRWPGGEVLLAPGRPVELPADRAQRLISRIPDRVKAVNVPMSIESIRPGCRVEWLSPALPKQQGEVLEIYPDQTFMVFHPLSEALCRLPMSWITRIITPATKDTR